jgi:uncharacterized membrane protein YeaQ/YmgE (transglycosylase-associated protein family)
MYAEAIELHALIVKLAVGLAAGWLAGAITQGRGFGVMGNTVVGIIGAFVGCSVLSGLGAGSPHGILGTIVMATVGAVILLYFVGLVRQ